MLSVLIIFSFVASAKISTLLEIIFESAILTSAFTLSLLSCSLYTAFELISILFDEIKSDFWISTFALESLCAKITILPFCKSNVVASVMLWLTKPSKIFFAVS